MTYTPSKETRQGLRDLYEMRGSYQKVADELNKGRRGGSKPFTRYQVRQMLNRKRVAHGEFVDNPTPVRLTEAQKRSLQRKTKEEGAVYRKSYSDYRENPRRSEKAYREIKERIAERRDALQRKKREAMKAGDRSLADKIQKDIDKYNQFDENLENAVDSADDYTDWKSIRDKVS
tara:strand:- start:6 stop:530 length:525 start_codon:yes stop_codon:yes gene_type:complete